ncbi:MAG: lysophospholipid acyltransferase family protein [Acidobacteriota bacterium]|nr:lysophospholipid acyltransferase family protein [Acidobacteriota bacterium]
MLPFILLAMSERPRPPISTRLMSYFVRNPLIYLYTVALGTVSLVCSPFDRRGRMQHDLARAWSWLILKTCGSPFEIEGLEKLDLSQPAIYAANHSSALDIPVLYVGLPFQFRILAKLELFRLPFLGGHLKRSGQIPIDRADARATLRSLSAASQTVNNGMPLVVFPEGGRSTDGHIQPFLGGVFYVAIKAQAPIVPMAIVGAYEALPMNTYVICPTRFKLVIGEPVPTAGLVTRDMEQLSAQVHQAMSDLFYAHSSLTPPVAEPQDAAVLPSGK